MARSSGALEVEVVLKAQDLEDLIQVGKDRDKWKEKSFRLEATVEELNRVIDRISEALLGLPKTKE